MLRRPVLAAMTVCLAIVFCTSATLAAPPAALPGAKSAAEAAWESPANVFGSRQEAVAPLAAYLERMSQPRPLVVRKGAEFKAHQQALRRTFLACAGLWPLPEKPPLDLRTSPPLDHEWCTVRRVNYQLWPQVYVTALLYMPKTFADKPAPAVLCPHGHWPDGNHHPVVQTRCLMLAKMGYVVLSTTQNHYEDLPWGISHQTLMIWTNIRGLDVLESLGEVDKARLGCTGCSGGGLQTQMLLAAEADESRVKAASIVGMTCEYREKIFPCSHHCVCNHFPNILRHAEGPELAALALPASVQFLTMNDWTRNFEKNNFPLLQELYAANGLAGRLDCHYEPTEHTYDKSKRERMYAWMEKHLRGREAKVVEPEVKTFPVKTLADLQADGSGNKGAGQISTWYAQRFAPAAAKVETREQWEAWRKLQLAALDDLLGKPLERGAEAAKVVAVETLDALTVEKVSLPSEGPVRVPVLVLRPAGVKGKLPLTIYAHPRGKAALLADAGPGSASQAARAGAMVVLADVRFAGELKLEHLAGLAGTLTTFKPASPVGERPPAQIPLSWERHAILWGRPFAAMAATDLRAVIDYALAREDADARTVRLAGYGELAPAAAFEAAGDERVTSLWLDFQGKCYQARTLPVVSFILRHGDLPHWLGLLAGRRVEATGLPPQAGDMAAARAAFKAAGNEKGLTVW